MLMRFIKAFVLCAALTLPAYSIAQVQALGFEIGTTTVDQVKDTVGKQTRIQDQGINRFSGGPQFKTDGNGYGVDTLTEVFYIFDKEQRLAAIRMEMSKDRFDEVFNFLAAKYKPAVKERPFVGNMFARFKPKGAIIELDAPHLGFGMQAMYIRADLYQQINAKFAQEAKEKAASEKAKF